LLTNEQISGVGKTFVLELREDSIRLIASLLHELVEDVEDDNYIALAKTALEHLVDQTTVVSKSPVSHRTYFTRKKKNLPQLVPTSMMDQVMWSQHLEVIGET
jgi:hypothetical protein